MLMYPLGRSKLIYWENEWIHWDSRLFWKKMKKEPKEDLNEFKSIFIIKTVKKTYIANLKLGKV